MARPKVDYQLFRRTYRDADGTEVEAPKWYGRYRDLRGKRARIALDENRDTSVGLIKAYVKAIRVARNNDAVSLEDVPPLLRERFHEDLCAVGHKYAKLANPRQGWQAHLDDYILSIDSKNRTADHVHRTRKYVEEVFTAAEFDRVDDIAPDPVQRYLIGMHRDSGASLEALNHRVRAVKGFARWLSETGRTGRHYLAALSTYNVREDRRHIRRTLTDKEFAKLLESTKGGQTRYGFTGAERWLLYVVAAGTGLRRTELQSLTWGNLRLDSPATWSLGGKRTKNRQNVSRPLLFDLPRILRETKAARGPVLPSAWVFPHSARWGKVALMIQADLDDAGIEYRSVIEEAETPGDEPTTDVFDFHSLRRQFCKRLIQMMDNADRGLNWVQYQMRHSTITLTMDIYGEISGSQRTEADEPAAVRTAVGG